MNTKILYISDKRKKIASVIIPYKTFKKYENIIMGQTDVELPRSAKTLYLINKRLKVSARGIYKGKKFIVFKNSKIRKNPANHFSDIKPAVKKRELLIKRGKIDEKYKFVEDTSFSSISLAATVILGRSANGKIEFRDKKTIY